MREMFQGGGIAQMKKQRKARTWWIVCDWDYGGCLLKYTKEEAKLSAKFHTLVYGKQRVVELVEILPRKTKFNIKRKK